MSAPDFSLSDVASLQAASALLKDASQVAVTRRDNWLDCFPEIIGRSAPMLRILDTVSKVARSDSAVLITGESGTGKELIAAALHRLSARSAKRFSPLNCSAIPHELLEAELFGHEKGAFTGADKRRAGFFEITSGGTLFLDEIGDMPQRLQAKLLRVLQEKLFTPLGASDPLRADVRIIAATNVDLEKAVAGKAFREDLYYRLNVLPIHLPPLRERTEDIPQLLAHFLENANRLHNPENPCYFSADVIADLVAYSWPGNVRELQNLVERLVVMRGGGEIRSEHLPSGYTHSGSAIVVPRPVAIAAPVVETVPSQQGATRYPADFGQLPSEGIDLPGFIEELEKNLILQALERTQNNKNQAARLLGLNRTTLVEKIKKRRIVALNNPSREL